jgi:hypothetical protein
MSKQEKNLAFHILIYLKNRSLDEKKTYVYDDEDDNKK